jgi:hypothetical protein
MPRRLSPVGRLVVQVAWTASCETCIRVTLTTHDASELCRAAPGAFAAQGVMRRRRQKNGSPVRPVLALVNDCCCPCFHSAFHGFSTHSVVLGIWDFWKRMGDFIQTSHIFRRRSPGRASFQIARSGEAGRQFRSVSSRSSRCPTRR